MVFRKSLCLTLVIFAQPILGFSLFHYEFPPLKQSVGRKELTLIDRSSIDPHSDGQLQRELPIRFWYPGIDVKKKNFQFGSSVSRISQIKTTIDPS